ncbi:hypothetical protein B0H21DRAFT_719142 [Amylocystis lapponica]|nr:hypothetical protein B0H21DRAFT_719142 [Amylocystis lapponica]
MQPSDESRSDESQASQLLRTVLRRDITSPNPHDPAVAHGSGGNSFPLQGSSTSTTSAKSPHPQYHFHGLAMTQTESQVEGQYDGEGSQKENTPTSWERSRGVPSSPVPSSSPPPVKTPTGALDLSARDASHSPTRPSRIAAVPMQDSRPVAQNAFCRAPLVNPNVLGTRDKKAVSFVSPIPSPHGAPHTRPDVPGTRSAPAQPLTRAKRQRSPSPSSQDSFAAPLPCEDPAQLFVANSKAFNMPLSEFGRDESIDDTSSPPLSSSRVSSMWSYRRIVPPSSPPGQILVAGTPSDPSHSQDARTPSQSQRLGETQRSDTSQQDGDTQMLDMFPPGQAQNSTLEFDNYRVRSPTGMEDGGGISRPSSPDKSTQPSPSYQQLLNLDPYAPNPEPDIATQIATQVATQIATQVDDEPTQLSDSAGFPVHESGPSTGINSVDDSHNPFGQARFSFGAQTTPSTSTATTTVPRGLAALIHPDKRRRYLGFAALQQEGSGDSDDVTGSTTPRPLVQDTQPSDVAVHGSALTSIPAPAPSPPPRRRQLNMPRRPADVPRSEVVPDSDAPEGGVRRNSRILSPPPTPLPTTPRRASKGRQASKADKDVEEDVVPESVALERGQSESEEGEDDIPLAAAPQLTRKQKGKEKEKVVVEPTPKASKGSTSRSKNAVIKEPVTEKKTTGRGRVQAASKSGDGPARQGRSWETSIVPSSNPRQDAANTEVASEVPSGIAATRKKKAPSLAVGLKTRSKSRSTTPAFAKRSRALPVEESSEGETAVSKDVEALIPDSDGEQSTELADDDQMDVDEESAPPSVSEPTSKRKRPPKKMVPRASTRSNKSATPVVRSVKKLKTSSTVKSGPSTATRVFALWKNDGHYYSGTVHSLVSTVPPRYIVHFDDNTQDTVDLSKMRLCQLRVGDHVLIIDDNQTGMVVECGDSGPDDPVLVEVDTGDELDQVPTEVQRIRIASRTLLSEWAHRTLSMETIWPIVRPKMSMYSPDSSKSTMASGGSVKGTRKFLAKTGFVVTLSPNNDNWEKDKDRWMLAIKNNGGIVLDDWTNVFAMEGCYSEGNKRWIMLKEDVKWTGRKDIKRVYLLSDAYNQKPKFLMALALGIPCVSIDWLEKIAVERCEKEWQPFLLAAGYCVKLDARISQVIDLDWGNSDEHMKDIMSNKVAAKLFANQIFLCVGPEFVPLPPKAAKRNTDAEKAKEASRMVPRIILGMGASSVEAVADVKYASQAELTLYDYVVVKEQSDVARFAANGAVNCVDLDWVKQCLIASRLLPR